MQLHINPHDEKPVYRQIQHQIARGIVDREIHPGELLASQQELAVQLAVSPSAVSKAYRELQSEGLCDEPLSGQFRVTHPGLESGRDERTNLSLSLLKKELLTQELRTAREIQRRLLPPAEICRESWTMQSRSFPAGSLAGDFYDVVEHPDGRVDVVIADVAGKGLGAGLIMAAAKSLIALAANQDSPGDALQELNARLFPVLGNREFVALAYARLDPAKATLEIANAGLPDPYLLHTRGGVEVLGVGGNRLPLGLREGLPYSTLTQVVDPDDRLLLVTDGIPEAVDIDGNPFGYEALTCLVESMNHPSGGRHSEGSGAWVDRLLDQVSRRTGSMLDDDWTAVLLECHGLEG